MGKIRKKQKRQWRKIDTKQLEEGLEKATHEERQGLAFERVPDADLFFVDTGGDDGTAAAVADGQLPASAAPPLGRKQGARQKLLRSQAILQALGSAVPVSTTVKRKPKGPAAGQRQLQQQQAAQRKGGGKRAGAGAPLFDIWADEEGGGGTAQAPFPATAAPPAEVEAAAISAKRRRTGAKPGVAAPHIPALEVDRPGCSFNPERELHQDAVAVAVAGEMAKLVDKELQPAAPPRTVDYDVERDELLMLQTLEAPDDDAVERGEGKGWEEGEEAGAGEGGGGGARRRREAGKKTRQDRSRAARRRAADEAAAAAARLKVQRRDIDGLRGLKEEVKQLEAEREARRARRAADRADRAAAQPPRLGKLPFEPMPVQARFACGGEGGAGAQVLTTSEVSGSLRRLKPTAMLAKDRFKSLQKRGAIEPRKRITQAKAGKKVEFMRGERAERALERQAEIEELRQQQRGAKAAARKG
eukprot:scaffold5.g644.t1